mmetsp:Transcript_14752/g.30900  ORF Transcript_14752/g.30900 Transcript_14752/m.30900 type:complete len:460 (+) Transcript_14752:93-1472(+)
MEKENATTKSIKMKKTSYKKFASSSTKNGVYKSAGNDHFTRRLHDLLSQPSNKDIMCWTSNGDAFCILNKNLFVERIMSVHFQNAKFASFSRRLKRWGFKRIDVNGKIPKIHGIAIFKCKFFKRGKQELCEFICDGFQASKSNRKIGAGTASNVSVKADVMTSKVTTVLVTPKHDIAKANLDLANEQKAGASVPPQYSQGSYDGLGFFSPAVVAASKSSNPSSSLVRSQGHPEQRFPVSLKSTHQVSPKLFLVTRDHLPIFPSQPIANKKSTSGSILFREQEIKNSSHFSVRNPSHSSPLALPPYSYGNRNSDDLFRAWSRLPRNLLPHDTYGPNTTPRLCVEFDKTPDLHSEKRTILRKILPRPHSEFQHPHDLFISHQAMLPAARPRFEETRKIDASNAHVSVNNYSRRILSQQTSIRRDHRVLTLADSIRSCEEELALVSRLRRLKEEQWLCRGCN